MDGMLATALRRDLAPETPSARISEIKTPAVEKEGAQRIHETFSELDATIIGKQDQLANKIAFAIPRLTPHEQLMLAWAQSIDNEIRRHITLDPNQFYTVRIRSYDAHTAKELEADTTGKTCLVALPLDSDTSPRGGVDAEVAHAFCQDWNEAVRQNMVLVTAYASGITEDQLVDATVNAEILDKLQIQQLQKLHEQMGKIIARATEATMQSPTAQVGLILALRHVNAMGEQLQALKKAIANAKNMQAAEVIEANQGVRSESRSLVAALEQAIPHLPAVMQVEMKAMVAQLRATGVTAETALALPQVKSVLRTNAAPTATNDAKTGITQTVIKGDKAGPAAPVAKGTETGRTTPTQGTRPTEIIKTGAEAIITKDGAKMIPASKTTISGAAITETGKPALETAVLKGEIAKGEALKSEVTKGDITKGEKAAPAQAISTARTEAGKPVAEAAVPNAKDSTTPAAAKAGATAAAKGDTPALANGATGKEAPATTQQTIAAKADGKIEGVKQGQAAPTDAKATVAAAATERDATTVNTATAATPDGKAPVVQQGQKVTAEAGDPKTTPAVATVAAKDAPNTQATTTDGKAVTAQGQTAAAETGDPKTTTATVAATVGKEAPTAATVDGKVVTAQQGQTATADTSDSKAAIAAVATVAGKDAPSHTQTATTADARTVTAQQSQTVTAEAGELKVTAPVAVGKDTPANTQATATDSKANLAQGQTGTAETGESKIATAVTAATGKDIPADATAITSNEIKGTPATAGQAADASIQTANDGKPSASVTGTDARAQTIVSADIPANDAKVILTATAVAEAGDKSAPNQTASVPTDRPATGDAASTTLNEIKATPAAIGGQAAEIQAANNGTLSATGTDIGSQSTGQADITVTDKATIIAPHGDNIIVASGTSENKVSASAQTSTAGDVTVETAAKNLGTLSTGDQTLASDNRVITTPSVTTTGTPSTVETGNGIDATRTQVSQAAAEAKPETAAQTLSAQNNTTGALATAENNAGTQTSFVAPPAVETQANILPNNGYIAAHQGSTIAAAVIMPPPAERLPDATPANPPVPETINRTVEPVVVAAAPEAVAPPLVQQALNTGSDNLPKDNIAQINVAAPEAAIQPQIQQAPTTGANDVASLKETPSPINPDGAPVQHIAANPAPPENINRPVEVAVTPEPATQPATPPTPTTGGDTAIQIKDTAPLPAVEAYTPPATPDHSPQHIAADQPRPERLQDSNPDPARLETVHPVIAEHVAVTLDIVRPDPIQHQPVDTTVINPIGSDPVLPVATPAVAVEPIAADPLPTETISRLPTNEPVKTPDAAPEIVQLQEETAKIDPTKEPEIKKAFQVGANECVGCDKTKGCCSTTETTPAEPDNPIKKSFQAGASECVGCDKTKGCCTTTANDAGPSTTTETPIAAAKETTPVPTCPRMASMLVGMIGGDSEADRQQMAKTEARLARAAAAKTAKLEAA